MRTSELMSRHSIPIFLLVSIPLLANAFPLVTGWSADPRYFVSGLSVGPQDSLLPGLPGWIDPHAGLTLESLGGLAAAEWLRGTIPWWNPYSGLGLPLAAEMQPGALFLPFVLLLSFGQGVILLKIVMQAIAGLATYALLRQLGLTRTAALIGGICYQLQRHLCLVRRCADPAHRLPAALPPRHRACPGGRARRPRRRLGGDRGGDRLFALCRLPGDRLSERPARARLGRAALGD
ncbi:hypothetical protein [Dankookia sp. P2]|uniref:hypothetical protein n=1 Tax=Dankookia sp. P2 TaxID=3423955 RepID=UPI003D66509D